MANQLGFFFDQTKCTGCKACQIACKDRHDSPVGVKWRRVAEYSGGSWVADEATGSFTNDVFAYYTSYSCNHCDDPICVESCPSTAMKKGKDGIVVVDPSICIGCKYCALACPYSAPQFDDTQGVMTKCDLCADWLAAGKQPACVGSCPSRALAYGDIVELRAKHGTQASIEPLPAASATKPNLVIQPHKRAASSGRGKGRVGNPKEI